MHTAYIRYVRTHRRRAGAPDGGSERRSSSEQGAPHARPRRRKKDRIATTRSCVLSLSCPDLGSLWGRGGSVMGEACRNPFSEQKHDLEIEAAAGTDLASGLNS